MQLHRSWAKELMQLSLFCEWISFHAKYREVLPNVREAFHLHWLESEDCSGSNCSLRLQIFQSILTRKSRYTWFRRISQDEQMLLTSAFVQRMFDLIRTFCAKFCVELSDDRTQHETVKKLSSAAQLIHKFRKKMFLLHGFWKLLFVVTEEKTVALLKQRELSGNCTWNYSTGIEHLLSSFCRLIYSAVELQNPVAHYVNADKVHLDSLSLMSSRLSLQSFPESYHTHKRREPPTRWPIVTLGVIFLWAGRIILPLQYFILGIVLFDQDVMWNKINFGLIMFVLRRFVCFVARYPLFLKSSLSLWIPKSVSKFFLVWIAKLLRSPHVSVRNSSPGAAPCVSAGDMSFGISVPHPLAYWMVYEVLFSRDTWSSVGLPFPECTGCMKYCVRWTVPTRRSPSLHEKKVSSLEFS